MGCRESLHFMIKKPFECIITSQVTSLLDAHEDDNTGGMLLHGIKKRKLNSFIIKYLKK